MRPKLWKVVHAEESFLDVVESTRNQIVFTTFRLIWIQTDVRLDPNQSENCKYNLISGWFDKTSEIFFTVCMRNCFFFVFSKKIFLPALVWLFCVRGSFSFHHSYDQKDSKRLTFFMHIYVYIYIYVYKYSASYVERWCQLLASDSADNISI